MLSKRAGTGFWGRRPGSYAGCGTRCPGTAVRLERSSPSLNYRDTLQTPDPRLSAEGGPAGLFGGKTFKGARGKSAGSSLNSCFKFKYGPALF